jgi:formylglycine-generating enzyme required for sulfatase activity
VVLVTAILLPLAAAAPAKDERRIALVIGISAYQNAPRLTNPVNDARVIGESLRRLKFDVAELYDLNLEELGRGIRDFGVRAATADVAVVYYAGHGVQVAGENYLIPANAHLERQRDLLYEAMPLNWLLGEVSQASKIGIVLLDSCRNNPFIERITRSMTIAGRAVATAPGLARVDNVPRNTMVAMAAKANQVAEDGGGEHSPFATALLAHLQIPGLELSLFFRSVRDTVLRATNNRQEPFVFSSLGAEPFYFYPRPPNRPPQIGAIPPLKVTDAAGPTPLGMPQPTDPDQDSLTVRIVALPPNGTVLIEGRAAIINAVYPAEGLRTATYKPDGKSLGAVGTLDILVEDGRGGSVAASLPITVKSSHRPPVVARPDRIHIAQQALGIPPPTSPDGDALTITVTALPRGTVGNGKAIVRTSDRLTPHELASLTFTPEPGFTGAAGALRYTVDNGHGSVVEGTADIDIGTEQASAAPNPETILWERVRDSADPAQLDAFLRLFPDSPIAAEAKHRRDNLTPPAASAAPTSSPQTAVSPASGSPRPVAPAFDSQNAAGHPVDVEAADTAPFTSSPVMMAAKNPAIALPSAIMSPEQFQDCPTCPRMMRIEAGSYIMGLGSREPEAMPAHRVEIHSFAIGIAPVTVAEWKACAVTHGCSEMPPMHVAEDETPVHNVSWDDAQTYVAWLARVTGHRYRLPNEAEWEYAARGGTTTRYWWGESAGVALANCVDCGGNQDAHGPWPVTTLRPNPFGLYDMLGGVAQWVEDCWFPNYQMAPTDGSAREMRNCQKRVLRGGSFRNRRDEITVMARGNYDGPVRYIANGFRVARDLD